MTNVQNPLTKANWIPMAFYVPSLMLIAVSNFVYEFILKKMTFLFQS